MLPARRYSATTGPYKDGSFVSGNHTQLSVRQKAQKKRNINAHVRSLEGGRIQNLSGKGRLSLSRPGYNF